MILLLRAVHIGLGVYWAGTILFFVTYLEPSLRSLGPDGGKVMIELFKRRYLTVLPIVALLTIVSGIWLLWVMSAGFDAAYMGSRMGIAISLGGTAAIVAFLIGVLVMRVSAMRIWQLARQMPQVTDEGQRANLGSEMMRHRARSVLAARWVAVLLAVAVLSMATARYL